MGSHKPRRLTSTVLSLMLVFSVLTAMNFASMNASAAYDETVIWIDGETIEDEIREYPSNGNDSTLIRLIKISTGGDLEIKNNGTLIFNDNVTFQIETSVAGEFGIKIEAGGKFVINSSLGNVTIKSDPGTPWNTYPFTNSGTIDFLGATVERVFGNPSDKTNTGGIRNEPGSVCELENCKLYDADTHSIFVDNSNLTLKGSNTRISPWEASNNEGCGIWINGSSNVNIEQITINNTQSYGIKCVDAHNVTIQNGVKVHNSSTIGIYLNSSNAVIKDSFIYDNVGYGISLFHSDSTTIENNHISNNSCGIRLESSTLTVNPTIAAVGENPDIVGLYSNDTVLLKLKTPYRHGDLGIEAINEIESKIDAKVLKNFLYNEILQLELNGKISVENAIRKLSNDPRVLYVEPDYILTSTATYPNDTYFSYLWGLHNNESNPGTNDSDIDAPEAWDISTGNNSIVVAVIDSGVDYNHEDLADNMWTNPNEIPGNEIDDDYNGYVDDVYGINAITGSGNPMDDLDHGTHCAGTIGAVGNNTAGVVGVNWNVSIMALKCINATGSMYTSDEIECLEYAIMMKEKGVNIIATSNSWGGKYYSQSLYDVIAASRDADILFVAAAMNDGDNTDYYPSYPASYNLTNIISVAATDPNDVLASFSNYGASSVDVAAPGVSIISTIPNGYDYMSGTSMAAPHVSGLAALIASTDSSYNFLNIKNLIMTTIDRKSSLSNKLVTEGRINAYTALNYTPSGLHMLIHSPGNASRLLKGVPIGVVVSLSDGVQPITNASVSVNFSGGESTITLYDNGTGVDQVADDGYYSGKWTPQQLGAIVLNISVNKTGYENISKELDVVVVRGNIITGNTITNNDYIGISLAVCASNGNTITNNNISSNTAHGIHIKYSNSNIVENNTVSNNGNGIWLIFGSSSTINNNTLSSNHGSGIHFLGSNNIIVENNTVSSNNQYGIYLSFWSNSITISKNILSNNDYYGIYLHDSDNNNITDNTVNSNDDHGIYISSSDNNNIDGNTANLNSDYGIYIQNSNDLTIDNNIVSNNSYGIYLQNSNDLTIDNNIIGLCYNHYVENETIYGPTFEGEEGPLPPLDNGNIINCTLYIDIAGTEWMKLQEGADYFLDYDTGVIDTTPIEPFEADWTFYAYYNYSEVGATGGNGYGIYIHSSLAVRISNNLISKNTDAAIYLNESSNTTITNNIASYNDYGIYINSASDNNSIYHNNFINNTNQANDSGNNNSWDNGYPSGGNYWSDFDEGSEGAYDNNSGPNQNIAGSDGIVDTPYTNISGSSNSNDTYPLMNQIVNGRVQRPPIRINSNPEFNSSNGVLSGAGTQGNPWIIEDYDINGTSLGCCIYIGNTTEHFTVRNNKLYSATGKGGTQYYGNVGLYLHNVTDGLIEDNIVNENNKYGVYLKNSKDMTLTDNTVSSNNMYGIYLQHSDDNLINDNYLSTNHWHGLLLFDSDNNTIEDNTASSNDMEGIKISSSDKNTINDNKANLNKNGIFVYNSENNTIDNNTASSNSFHGFYLYNSDNNTIEDNIASSNNFGILLYLCGNNTINDNKVSSNDYGIGLNGSSIVTITNNTASSNDYHGIYLRNSDNNTIKDNDIENNTLYGVYLNSTCDNNSIYHNNFMNNYDALHSQAYDDGSNSWNNSYDHPWQTNSTDCGNHWSDHSTTDTKHGKNQNINEPDGIVDLGGQQGGRDPYSISGSANAQDEYPFVLENGWTY